HISLFLFSYLHPPPPPISTLFPYTTLFRSRSFPSPARATRHWGGGLVIPGVTECDRPRHFSAPPELPRRRFSYNDHMPTLTETLDRKSTRLNSSHVSISYAVFCLKKKTT